MKHVTVYTKNQERIFGSIESPEDMHSKDGVLQFPDSNGKIHMIPWANIQRIQIQEQKYEPLSKLLAKL